MIYALVVWGYCMLGPFHPFTLAVLLVELSNDAPSYFSGLSAWCRLDCSVVDP